MTQEEYDKMMKPIEDAYQPNIYYIISTGKLSKDPIPGEYHYVLACPPPNNQECHGYNTGDLVQFEKSTTCSQIVMMWPSMNRVELSMFGDKFGRADYAGGTIETLINSTVLIKASEIVEFYLKCYPIK